MMAPVGRSEATGARFEPGLSRRGLLVGAGALAALAACSSKPTSRTLPSRCP